MKLKLTNYQNYRKRIYLPIKAVTLKLKDLVSNLSFKSQKLFRYKRNARSNEVVKKNRLMEL